MNVIIAQQALDDLNDIWAWSVLRYGLVRASDYDTFLRSRIRDLGHLYHLGRRLPKVPSLQSMSAQMHPRKPGHVLIYRVAPEYVEVVHVVHTARDWQKRLP